MSAGAESDSVRPESFFERVGSVNPFTDNRVNGPLAGGVDVPDIHQAAFEQLLALAEEAHAQRRGLGAVLWGEAGVGKSHLLSRLAHWAGQDKRACLVYVHNLQASPANLPRSLLKAVVSQLTRGQTQRLHTTTLFRLVEAAVAEALHHDRETPHPWPEAEQAYRRLIDSLSAADAVRATLVDRTVYAVLFRFYHSSYRAWQGRDDGVASLAVRWLSGDTLDPDEATRLSLPLGRGPQEAVALADNQHVKQVLVALTQLALYRRQPFLLCFDQVDNLDVEQAAALARFLEALVDSSCNLLVVTAGIQASLVRWHGDRVIQDSAWDRLAQFQVALHRVAAPQASRIITTRLAQVLQPFRALEAVKEHQAEDDLFPLGRAWHEEYLRDKIEVRPRDAINWAREGWRREQQHLREVGGAAWLAEWGRRRPTPPRPVEPAATGEPLDEIIDRKISQKIAEHAAWRQQEPHTLPPDADHLTGLICRLLEQCRPAHHLYGTLEVEQILRPKHKTSPYEVEVRQRPGPDGEEETRTGLLCLTTSAAASTTTALRRLLKATRPSQHLVLVTDERRPLVLAAKGKEYYERLRRRKGGTFHHVKLTFAQYAGLDALQAVVSLARSGDLEIEVRPGQTRPLSEPEVIASHQRQGRYREAAVLRELLARETAGARI